MDKCDAALLKLAMQEDPTETSLHELLLSSELSAFLNVVDDSNVIRWCILAQLLERLIKKKPELIPMLLDKKVHAIRTIIDQWLHGWMPYKVYAGKLLEAVLVTEEYHIQVADLIRTFLKATRTQQSGHEHGHEFETIEGLRGYIQAKMST